MNGKIQPKKKISAFGRKVNYFMTRKITVIILLLIQISLICVVFNMLSGEFQYIYVGLTVIAAVIAVYLAINDENPGYKVAWLVPLVVFPAFMALAYLYLKLQINRHFFQKLITRGTRHMANELSMDEHIKTETDDENNVYFSHLSDYLMKECGFPTYKNTSVKYYGCGEDQFVDIITELEKAEKYIFIEFFIVEDGVMLQTLIKILKRKVKEGVEVRFMYDGVGAQTILPGKYDELLRRNGIACKVFNRFKPFLSTEQNNRDHRKIIVIDGHTAFTGGTNIADEYINEKVKFGYWKDSAVMVKGEAVWSFVVMFFQMWELDERRLPFHEKYRANKETLEIINSDGYVVPYGDCPLDNETVGRMIYLDIITKAKKYIYITAPYLILDNELITALIFAAKTGIEIKIIVPGITDKWYVQKISNCYYAELLKSNIKFYKYKPGFIHQKNMISDDNIATCGTVNLDYRSLYLHFEDGIVMYKNSAIEDMKFDFETILQNDCERLTKEEMDKRNIFDKIFSNVLKIFGPLL